MKAEVKNNFIEKIRLVSIELISNLDHEYESMLRKHSATGQLGSGNTIRKTMDFIASANANLYDEVLNYIEALKLDYNKSLEGEIEEVAKSAQADLKTEVLIRLKKSTEVARSPNLYERMVLKVESAMELDLANFLNSLNASVIKLKSQADAKEKEGVKRTVSKWALTALGAVILVMLGRFGDDLYDYLVNTQPETKIEGRQD